MRNEPRYHEDIDNTDPARVRKIGELLSVGDLPEFYRDVREETAKEGLLLAAFKYEVAIMSDYAAWDYSDRVDHAHDELIDAARKLVTAVDEAHKIGVSEDAGHEGA